MTPTRSRTWSRVLPRASGLDTAYPGRSAAGRVRAHFLAMRRPVPSAMTTRPIPTARGRRFGAGGRRGCRVHKTCRRAAPNRVRKASLHSTLIEGIGATLATTAGGSASPRRVDKRHRLHLANTITLGPSHVERMQICAARDSVASMRKLAPAWGSPARREDPARPHRSSRLSRTSTNIAPRGCPSLYSLLITKLPLNSGVMAIVEGRR